MMMVAVMQASFTSSAHFLHCKGVAKDGGDKQKCQRKGEGQPVRQSAVLAFFPKLQFDLPSYL